MWIKPGGRERRNLERSAASEDDKAGPMTDYTYLYIQLWTIVVLAVADLLVLIVDHPELGAMGVQPN